MRYLKPLLVLSLLAGCAAPQDRMPHHTTVADVLANGTVCRVGSDGEPVIADRGIGGTGAPQGIQDHAPSRLADRGIGGTGIIGVITGFASVCVDGLEVRYDRSTPVDVDGTPASSADLRAGQMVFIQTRGSPAAPAAQTISVRREVTGRVEAIDPESSTLTIAGQQISVPPEAWSMENVRLGDWLAVSGLHRANGTLVASRLDTAPAGAFAVHGPVRRVGTQARIGQLVLPDAAAAKLKDGQFATVSGRYQTGQPVVTATLADSLRFDPDAYFDPGIDHLVVQSFVRVARGKVWLNGLAVPAAPSLHTTAGEGIAVVSLKRRPNGYFTAVAIRYTDITGSSRALGHATHHNGLSSRHTVAPPPLGPEPAAMDGSQPLSAIPEFTPDTPEPESSTAQPPSIGPVLLPPAADLGQAISLLPTDSGAGGEAARYPQPASLLAGSNPPPAANALLVSEASAPKSPLVAWNHDVRHHDLTRSIAQP